MAKSFLDKFSPNRQRSKVVEWPFPVADGETPKVRVSVLGADKMEAAAIEVTDHFKKIKQKIGYDDPLWTLRERASQVWHAYADVESGDPLTDSVDELVKHPQEVITRLWIEWAEMQSEASSTPKTDKEIDALIDDLKKNTPSVQLSGLSSTTLSRLVLTLVAQSAASTPASESGG